MTRTKLETMKDEEGGLWVQTHPGNWEKYSIWKERIIQKEEILRNGFGKMKRKELQSLAKSRGISGNKTNQEYIDLLVHFNVPYVDIPSPPVSRYFEKQWERFNIEMEKKHDIKEAVVEHEPDPKPEEDNMYTRRRTRHLRR